MVCSIPSDCTIHCYTCAVPMFLPSIYMCSCSCTCAHAPSIIVHVLMLLPSLYMCPCSFHQYTCAHVPSITVHVLMLLPSLYMCPCSFHHLPVCLTSISHVQLLHTFVVLWGTAVHRPLCSGGSFLVLLVLFEQVQCVEYLCDADILERGKTSFVSLAETVLVIINT